MSSGPVVRRAANYFEAKRTKLLHERCEEGSQEVASVG